MTAELERQPTQPQDAVQRALWTFARSLVVAIFAGALAGAVAGGAGGRIAMRISTVAAPDAEQGTLTDAEQVVGQITFGGTVELIIFGGVLTGLLGGLVYLATRRWLADAGRWRWLAFGLVSLATFGWAVIEGNNPDFHRFGPPALNITMFAAIYLLFGVLVAPLFDWFDRLVPHPVLDQRIGALILPFELSLGGLGTALLYGIGLLFAFSILGAVGSGFGEGGNKALLFTFLPAYVLLVVPAASFLIARTVGPFGRLSDLRAHQSALAAAICVVVLPLVAGLLLDVQAVVDIYRADR